MHWYHWIASYLLIAVGVVFTVIPDKPWWLWVAIFVAVLIVLALAMLPSKVDPVLQKSLEQREAKRLAEQEKSGE
jgi:hypothetical protein